MKPYGLSRYICFSFPDKADSIEMGTKTRDQPLHSRTRRNARRRWARKARAAGKAACNTED